MATAGIPFTRKGIKFPAGSKGLGLEELETATSSNTGLVQFTDHYPGATYEITCADGSATRYVAESSSFSIGNVFGGSSKQAA